MSGRWPGLRAGWPLSAAGVLALGATDVLCLLWGSQGGTQPAAARELAAVLLGHAAGLAALLWIALDRRLDATPVAWVLLAGFALRLAATQAAPLLEDDHHRYLWDGHRSATALDPYRLPPEAFFGVADLSPAWQAVLSGINHPELPTLYGPLLQALFAAAHGLAPAELMPLKALLLLADLCVLSWLARWGVGRRWLWAYALHPLVFKEALASAHPDGVLALLLLACAWAWQRGAALRLGVLIGAAVATKVAALVVLPLLLIRPAFVQATPAQRIGWALRVAAAGWVALALLYAPFLWGGGSDAAGLRAFGQHWRFNPLGYRVLEALWPAGGPVRGVAGLLVLAAVAGVAWRWLLRAGSAGTGVSPIVPAMCLALLALLLCSPVVNPWYWLWLLPLAVAAGRSSALVAGVVAVLSYLNGHVLALAWPGSSAAALLPYAVPWPVTFAQLLVLALALWIDARRGRAAPGAPHNARDQRTGSG